MLTTIIAFSTAGEEIGGAVGNGLERVARVEKAGLVGRFCGSLIGTGVGILYVVLTQSHDTSSKERR